MQNLMLSSSGAHNGSRLPVILPSSSKFPPKTSKIRLLKTAAIRRNSTYSHLVNFILNKTEMTISFCIDDDNVINFLDLDLFGYNLTNA
jgi:hypothetical protein